MSTPLSKPFAVGRTAEIYAWKDGQVLKLFREWCPRNWVDYEWRISHIVQAAGLPVPAVSDIVEINGRAGLVYERVDGPSMLHTIKSRLWSVRQLARQFAELHAAMHDCTVPDLPAYKDRLAHDIRSAQTLPDDLKASVLERLALLPDGDCLCHGDLHPDNIIMTRRGPMVIDWMTACRGHPLADVSRTCLLLYAGSPPDMSRPMLLLLGLIRNQFATTYLQRYFQLRPAGRDLLAAWRPIIAAARLNENIEGEREPMLARVRTGLALP